MYIDQKVFAIKLDRQMKDEVERFRGTIMGWTPKKLEKLVIELIN